MVSSGSIAYAQCHRPREEDAAVPLGRSKKAACLFFVSRSALCAVLSCGLRSNSLVIGRLVLVRLPKIICAGDNCDCSAGVLRHAAKPDVGLAGFR